MGPHHPHPISIQPSRRLQDICGSWKGAHFEKRIIRHAFQAIHNTGLYNIACDEWNDSNNPKTWANFKSFFIKKNKNIEKHTTGSIGLANTEVANALLDVTTTLDAYRSEIENLKSQLDNNTAAPNNSTISQSQFEQFLATMQQQRVAPPPAPESSNSPVSDPRIQGYNEKGFPISYCWSCGITHNLAHSSATCKTPLKGHIKTATYTNRQGGTNKTTRQVIADRKAKKVTETTAA